MALTYQQITQEEIKNKIRKRYGADIDALKQRGFEELCFYSETASLGLLLGFIVLLLSLLRREVVKIQGRLTLVTFAPLLVAREYATCATCSSFGVTFYTRFTDGTLLISQNHKALDVVAEGTKCIRYADTLTVESAWELHQARVNELRSEGKQTEDAIHFENYVETLKRERQSIKLELEEDQARNVDHKRSGLDLIVMFVSVFQVTVVLLALLVAFIRGTRVALVGIVVFLPVFVNVTLIIVLKDSFLDLFDIPKNAYLAKKISMFLYSVLIPTSFLAVFQVLPYSYFLAVWAALLLYDNYAAAYYRLQRLKSRRRGQN